MSRSGYSYDDEGGNWSFICWRGAVNAAMRGARGQSFLQEMIAALDALPEKKLITDELEEEGGVCAIGAVGRARGIDMSQMDPHEPESVAAKFGIAPAMAKEIVYMNDERFDRETPEERFTFMRNWAKREIWDAKGCVDDPFGFIAVGKSKRPHWKSVIEWNEV